MTCKQPCIGRNHPDEGLDECCRDHNEAWDEDHGQREHRPTSEESSIGTKCATHNGVKATGMWHPSRKVRHDGDECSGTYERDDERSWSTYANLGCYPRCERDSPELRRDDTQRLRKEACEPDRILL